MKRTTKILAIIITLIMIVGVVTPFASAKSINDVDTSAEENLSQTQKGDRPLTTAEQLLKIQKDNEKPEDYDEEGHCISGIEKDEPVQAVTCDEILTIGKNEKEGKNGEVKVFESLADKENGSCTIKDIESDFASCIHTTFDPNSTGHKDHAAFLGYKYYKMTDDDDKAALYELVLDIVDLTTMETVATKSIHQDGEMNILLGYEDTVDASELSIDTACFDNKFDNTLVVSYVIQHNDINDRKNNQLVEFYKLNDNKLENIKSLDMLDYMQNASYDAFSREVYPGHPAPGYDQFSIALGDFDRDYKDELAIIATFINNYLEADVDSSYYATEIVIIDNPTDEKPEKVYDDFIKDSPKADDKFTYFNTLLFANITSGDIDANEADDLIIGGLEFQGSFQKKYDSDVRRLPFDFSQTLGEQLTQGLVFVSFNGTEYVKSQIKEFHTPMSLSQMQPRAMDYKLSLETAYMKGHNQPCSIFLNGKIYDYIESNLVESYTYEYFTKKYEVTQGSSNAPYINLYVNQVQAGNITNDNLGHESFVFSMHGITRCDGGYSISSSSGYISLDESGNYYDNTNSVMKDDSGHLNTEWYFEYTEGLFVPKTTPAYSVILADVDVNDGVRIKYVGSGYIYADPQVTAVIQAAPYFKQLGDWNKFMGSTEYSIITAHSSTKGGSTHWTTEVGAVESVSGGVEGIASVEMTLSEGYSRTNTTEWSNETTKTTTEGFKACATDTVVINRTPIVIYAYNIWDNEKGEWMKDGDKYVQLMSATKLSPSFYQMTFDEYNEYVDEYNKGVKEEYKDCKEDDKDQPIYLKKIKTANYQKEDAVSVVPINTTGNPCNYRKDATAIAPLYVSAHSHSLGYTGGSQTEEHEKTETRTDNSTFEKGYHIHGEVTAQASLFDIVDVKVGAYIDNSQSWGESQGDSETNGVSGAGEVVDIDYDNYLEENHDMLTNYHFNWKYCIWETVLQDDYAKEDADELRVPVLEYLVLNSEYSGQYPSKVFVEFPDDKNVLVKWEEPNVKEAPGAPTLDDDSYYHIYRRLKDEDFNDLVEVGKVPANAEKLEFTEPISNLLRGKSYQYFVGCDYKGVNKPYTSISIKLTEITRNITIEYMVGDSNDNGRIDIVDGTLIQRQIAELYDGDESFCQRASVQNTGVQDITDVTLIQKYIAHISTDYDNVIGSKKAYK